MVSDEATQFCNQVVQQLVDENNNPIVINGLFLELINKVVWRLVTGKAIERGPKLTDLKVRIREFFRGAERGRLTYIIQASEEHNVVKKL